MSLTYVDPQEVVKSLLEDNWTKANTDDLEPEVDIIEDFEAKRYPMGLVNKSQIFIYAKTGSIENANGIGSQAKEVIEPVSIDLRIPKGTNLNKSHFYKVVGEIIRILDSNEKNPSDDFDYIDPEKTKLNLSNKKSSIWREVIDIKLIRKNVPKT